MRRGRKKKDESYELSFVEFDVGQKSVVLGLASRTFGRCCSDIHVVHGVHQKIDNSKSQCILRPFFGNFYRGS